MDSTTEPAAAAPILPGWLARFASLATSVAGILVLTGWGMHLVALKSLSGRFVAMNPATAAGFILAGASLWLLATAPSDHGRWRHAAGRAGGAIVALLGLSKLVGIAIFDGAGIDGLLFASKLASDPSGFPNRMAPMTAVGFMLAGSALASLDARTSRGLRPAEPAALLAGLVSLFAIVGYAYGVQAMYTLPAFIPMALHTAVAFALLSLGILAARPPSGLLEVFGRPGPGGVAARRLIPAVIGIPVVLGWLRNAGERLRFYDGAAGTALMVVGITALLGILTWKCAGLLDRADRARRHALEKLAAANEELEAFSYSVSHDLRAPLRHIAGFADILAEQGAGLDQAARRTLDKIIAAARRMNALIDDLLSFSRMARAEMSSGWVDLTALLDEVLGQMEDETRGRTIAWEIAPLPRVQADPAMLRQVFTNLLSNALKYTRTRQEARVAVGTETRQDETVIWVRDNGVGFDMQHASRLFGAFQRLHRADDFEGTGIGLANVRRIVGRHGGRTWAEAAPDQGACFYFSLPLRREAA